MRLAMILLALAAAPILVAQDYRPLDEADRGSDPAHDFWSRLQEQAFRMARLDTSDPVRVLVLPIEFVDLRGRTSTDELAAHFFGDDENSLASYYAAVSGGRVVVEGTVHDWVEAILPRRLLTRIPTAVGASLYYSLLLEHLTLAELDDLEGYDVVVFVIAGPRVARWSTLLWPHAGIVTRGGRGLEKIVLAERAAEDRGFSRQTLHHEFGHTLGIADKYCYLKSFGIDHECDIGRVGRHCLMGWGGSPCAWCRIEMAWTEPVVLARQPEQALRFEPLEKGGRVAKIYLGTRSRYLLIAFNQGQLRVWRLGEPWQRIRNHLFWIDLDGVVAEVPEGEADYDLPGDLAIRGAHIEGGQLRLRLVDRR